MRRLRAVLESETYPIIHFSAIRVYRLRKRPTVFYSLFMHNICRSIEPNMKIINIILSAKLASRRFQKRWNSFLLLPVTITPRNRIH